MTEFLATFQVAGPVLSAVTGLEALCFVLAGLQPARGRDNPTAVASGDANNTK